MSPEFVSIRSMMNCTWLTYEKSSREGFFFPSGNICRWHTVVYWNCSSDVQLEGRGRFFDVTTEWSAVSAVGPRYNARRVTALPFLMFFSSPVGSKLRAFCKYSEGSYVSPSRIKNLINVSFCIIIIVQNLFLFIFPSAEKLHKGLNLLGGGESKVGLVPP